MERNNSMEESQKIAELQSKIDQATNSISELSNAIQQQKIRLSTADEKIRELQKSSNSAIKIAGFATAQIERIKLSSENYLKQIEEDSRKANSESGFAYNAKGNAEEHAKAIAQIRGTVESTFSSLVIPPKNH
jgi:chromosome segregation ATPase